MGVCGVAERGGGRRPGLDICALSPPLLLLRREKEEKEKGKRKGFPALEHSRKKGKEKGVGRIRCRLWL